MVRQIQRNPAMIPHQREPLGPAPGGGGGAASGRPAHPFHARRSREGGLGTWLSSTPKVHVDDRVTLVSRCMLSSLVSLRISPSPGFQRSNALFGPAPSRPEHPRYWPTVPAASPPQA